MSNMIVRIMYYCKLMKSYIEVKSWNGISADMDKLLDVDWLVDIDLRSAKKAKVLVERTREEPFEAPLYRGIIGRHMGVIEYVYVDFTVGVWLSVTTEST